MNELTTELSTIEEKLSYQFKKKELLILAFTHRSYWNEHKEELAGHNERLEFLGDSVLGFLVAEYLYKSYPELPEGSLSDLRAEMVKAATCASFLLQLSLEKFLLLGKGEERNAGKGRKSIIADLFEALMGAIYLDGGYRAAKNFFFSHFEKRIEEIVAKPEINWKAKLQDYVQKRFHKRPIYEVIEEVGPSHAKHFLVAVIIEGKKIAEGRGESKKGAQIDAAKKAYAHYEGNSRTR